MQQRRSTTQNPSQMQDGQICPPRTSEGRGGARCHGRYLQAFFCPPPLALTSGLSTPSVSLSSDNPSMRERPERESIEAIRPLRPTANKPYPSAIRSLLLVVWESRGVKEGRDRVAGAGGEEEEEETDRFSPLLFFTNMKERSAHSVALRTKHQSRWQRE